MKKNFKPVFNFEKLIKFLKNGNNSYTQFILSKLERTYIPDKKTQKHHIIPKHQGGPDGDGNIIRLTLEEHATAHQLLFENYNTEADLGASQMLSGQIELGCATIRRMALETRRTNKTDFFSSKVQQELASRTKKKRACYARNRFILAALTRGFKLYNCISKDVVEIGPYQANSIVDVVNKLMLHPQMSILKEEWFSFPKKEKHSAVNSLTRMLTGHMDKKTNKSVFSYKNWWILGINLLKD